jgi:hypothetical protein
MSAVAEMLVRDLAARGIRLSRNGDRLHVEGRPGSITPKLREMLAEAKPAILDCLSAAEPRHRLLTAADVEGIDPACVRALSVADIAACADFPDEVLRAYVRALRDAALRQRGWAPDDETAVIRCVRCGPVFAAPEVSHVLPIVDGMPTSIGCPWCWNRVRGIAIPHPPLARVRRTVVSSGGST